MSRGQDVEDTIGHTRPAGYRTRGALTGSLIMLAGLSGTITGCASGGVAGGPPSSSPAGVTGALRLTLADPSGGAVLDTAFSPGRKTLATGDSSGNVSLWNAGTGTLITTFQTDDAQVFSVAFSGNGALLAAASQDSGTYVWDVATGKRVAMLASQPFINTNSAEFSPDGTVLAVANEDGTINLWDTTTWHKITTLTDPSTGGANMAAFSPDGKTLAVADNTGVTYLWSIATHRVTGTLGGAGHGTADNVSFSPDGRSAAIGYQDGTMIVASTGTGGTIATMPPQSPSAQLDDQHKVTAVYSPGGNLVAAATTGGDGHVSLYGVPAHRVDVTLDFPGSPDDTLSPSVAFSPDGTELAAAGGQLGKTFVWKLAGPGTS